LKRAVRHTLSIPLIEESEKLMLRTLKTRPLELSKEFKPYKVDLLHGRIVRKKKTR
jgi:RecG-like helicase